MTIVSKGTGTLSVAKEERPNRDVDHRRFPVFDLKDLSDLKDFKDFKDTTPCSREANVP